MGIDVCAFQQIWVLMFVMGCSLKRRWVDFRANTPHLSRLTPISISSHSVQHWINTIFKLGARTCARFMHRAAAGITYIWTTILRSVCIAPSHLSEYVRTKWKDLGDPRWVGGCEFSCGGKVLLHLKQNGPTINRVLFPTISPTPNTIQLGFPFIHNQAFGMSFKNVHCMGNFLVIRV